MAEVSSVDICRVRGDTSPFTITITDGTAPIDVTGFSFKLAVDPAQEPTDALNNLFALEVGTGITLTTPASGIITVTLSLADSDQTPSQYFYDLQWTDTSGFVRTIMRGGWEVQQDISK